MPEKGTLARWVVHACIATVAVCAARAQDTAAQPAAKGADTDLKRFVADLGSPDAATRVAAQAGLTEQPAIKLKQIEEVLRNQPLTPEQRRRLLTAAHHRFLTEPRAAMGIRFDFQSVSIHGVALAQVIPGFPASDVLRAGDRVISAAGHSIEAQEQDATDAQDMLRAVIISRDPGDEIPITVVRDGATMNLKIKLGSYRDLETRNNPGNPALDASRLAKPWELRSKDLVDPELRKTKPIESGLSAAAWDKNADAETEESDMARIMGGTDTDRTGLVAGGEPRGGVAPQPSGPAVLHMDFGARPAPLQIQAQLDVHRVLLQQLQGKVDMIEAQLRDPNLPVAPRQLLRNQLDVLQRQVQLHTDEMRMLEMQRNGAKILPR